MSTASPLHAVHTTETNGHAQTYIDAIRKERQAEADSIVAAWEAGHAFRAHDDPVAEISDMTGMSMQYIHKRIRLAGAYTKAQLVRAIDRSGAVHFTEFYSWTFREGTHSANQMGKHRSVRVPVTHWKYFESRQIDVSAAVKELLEVLTPAELHALLRQHLADVV